MLSLYLSNAASFLVRTYPSSREDRHGSARSPTAMRIVSLLPSLTEIVAALGLGDSIVGLTHSCDYPKEAVEGKVVVTSTEISPYTMSQAQIHTTPPTPPACLPGIPRGY